HRSTVAILLVGAVYRVVERWQHQRAGGQQCFDDVMLQYRPAVSSRSKGQLFLPFPLPGTAQTRPED
ncbi:hypothetical protein GN156_35385, partial [bacterium LRH843]|nr:hypothetical protein [bacterium LRH843]